ncbi:MAG: YwaF family protein [Clostridia bacterium]|nr:YwaF family protein [Clostridia bacterium]
MIREFCGFGGYTREPEGYLSWQHLAFVTSLMIIMVVLAFVFGKKHRNDLESDKKSHRVLVISAIVIDVSELIYLVILCLRSKNPFAWLYDLPLFLCSIQMISIPLAAFSKGRLKDAAKDFVCIFGVLGAVMGTYAAGNNYSCYPVFGIENVSSGIIHAVAGFTALYIFISGKASMKKRNIWITFTVLLGFCVAAYVANILLDYNYMFLMRGDGTPYDIVYNWVGGSPVLYPISVVLLFLIYICVFYGIYFIIEKPKKKSESANADK